jgi:Mn2+/Fe2+ NRAMP family transporter
MLMAMGPAIVVTGSVIGSGELINVPKQAATFGFVLFWAVIISCVIKYFLQVELGRFCLVHNQTTIQAFNNCPGPKFRGTSWVGILYMFGYTASMVTLTGILGATAGIFQTLMPLESILPLQHFVTSSNDPSLLEEALRIASKNIWAGLTLLVIMLILWRGLYGELEKLVTILVAGFSLSVVLALFLVQTSPYSLSANDIFSGLKFSLGSVNRDAAAFAVVSLLGALGTTANELFMYPYWILEKGYAQHLGPRDSDGWVERARGWLRVLRLDTASATLLATVITAAYYLVASAVLHERVVRNEMKVPEGMDVVEQISAIFTEIYGPWSYWIFMFGGFCTLFSTLVVVTAATGRMWSDLLSSMGWIDWENESSRRRCNRTFQTIYLTAFLLIEVFVNIPPGQRVIIGQYINGLVNTPLIMFGICWLAFHTDRRVRMSRFTAVMLFATVAVILTCLGVGLAV